jgi:hypothetical protein
MPTVTATAVLNAPPAHAWALLRDFAGIGGWHPLPPPVRDALTGRFAATEVAA